MIRETELTEKIIVKHKYCDVCDSEIKMGLSCSAARCEICQHDLCDNCIGKEKDTLGDYREVYCKTCWEIGKLFRDKIDEHENAIQELNNEWIRLCI